MVIHQPRKFGLGAQEAVWLPPGSAPLDLDGDRPRPGTVQRLYSAHVLERMHPEQGDKGGYRYLADCMTLLAPGGVMRLVSASINAPLSLLIPKDIQPGSIMAKYREWLATRDSPTAEHIEHIVSLGLYGVSRQRAFLWSAQMLRTKLLASGRFRDVYTKPLNQSDFEEFRDLEKDPPMPFEIYEYETFVVEAIKQ